MTKTTAVDPLREFLEAVVTRIETLEAHCGLSGAAPSSSVAKSSTSSTTLEKTPSARHISGDGRFYVIETNKTKKIPEKTIILLINFFFTTSQANQRL